MLLRDKDRKKLLDIAAQEIKTAVEIWAYGSRVSGRAHDCSDLDLVICTKDKGKLGADEMLRFKQRLADSNIPFLIDVLDWGIIPQSFKDNILANYRVLGVL